MRRALDAIGVPEFAPFLEQRGVQPANEPLARGAMAQLARGLPWSASVCLGSPEEP